jgi:hypothetical protein
MPPDTKSANGLTRWLRAFVIVLLVCFLCLCVIATFFMLATANDGTKSSTYLMFFPQMLFFVKNFLLLAL